MVDSRRDLPNLGGSNGMGLAGSRGVDLGGRVRSGGGLELEGDRRIVSTSTNRSSTHKLQSKAEHEDKTNGK